MMCALGQVFAVPKTLLRSGRRRVLASPDPDTSPLGRVLQSTLRYSEVLTDSASLAGFLILAGTLGYPPVATGNEGLRESLR